jgi:hypothetical protein
MQCDSIRNPKSAIRNPSLLHPRVEDLNRRGLVDEAFLLLRLFARGAEFARGGGGGEGFVDENERQVWQPRLKLGREGADFSGGIAFAAVHTHGQTDDQRLDATLGDQLGDSFDRLDAGTVDRFHRMRENAEVIRRSDADAGVAVIDAEGGVGTGVVSGQ